MRRGCASIRDGSSPVKYDRSRGDHLRTVNFEGALTDEDRKTAVVTLQDRLEPAVLREVVDGLERRGNGIRRSSVESIVSETESTRRRPPVQLDDDQLADYLVDRFGIDLLSRPLLREALALHASDQELRRLHSYAGSVIKGGRGRENRAFAVAQRPWQAGRSWARHFVDVLGFPAAFAGLPGMPREPDAEEVTSFVPLKGLEDFQRDLVRDALAVLTSARGRNRAVLTLPTGAGKTRTAVETLIRWKVESRTDRAILWIAQSEELCEQAVEAFREVWIDMGHRSRKVRGTLQIARFWGDRPVPDVHDVVVASIQKLHAMVGGRRGELDELGERVGVVVVDEAHRLTAPSYARVLRRLGVDLGLRRSSERPLLGLTATPFRRVDQETRQLARRFHSRLLTPGSLGADMVTALRARKVLSRPEHRVIRWNGRTLAFDSVERYRAHFEQFQDFPPEFLRDVGRLRARNKKLLDELLKLPPDWPVLFFGCTVEHAEAMAVLLRRRGRTAASVTAGTRAGTRRALIEDFRQGRVSVLCNYGVLTTGFDAPRVRAVVVGRPTTSPVLYEQMIGRGMRGPRFGGTDVCRVVDIADNIAFQGTLAYKRYVRYWK
jgi:superfamily II DNA or RNA helicase